MGKRTDKYIQEALRKLNTVSTNLKDIINKEPAKAEEDVDEAAKTVIARWYASYEPMFYNRSGSLYKAYKIKRDFMEIEVDFDSKYMAGFSHHQSNETVYQNAFEQGYHGGSRGTDRWGSTKSEPTWRTPLLHYTFWGDTAARGFSPKEVIEDIGRDILEAYDRRVDHRIDREVISVLNSI